MYSLNCLFFRSFEHFFLQYIDLITDLLQQDEIVIYQCIYQ